VRTRWLSIALCSLIAAGATTGCATEEEVEDESAETDGGEEDTAAAFVTKEQIATLTKQCLSASGEGLENVIKSQMPDIDPQAVVGAGQCVYVDASNAFGGQLPNTAAAKAGCKAFQTKLKGKVQAQAQAIPEMAKAVVKIHQLLAAVSDSFMSGSVAEKTKFVCSATATVLGSVALGGRGAVGLDRAAKTANNLTALAKSGSKIPFARSFLASLDGANNSADEIILRTVAQSIPPAQIPLVVANAVKTSPDGFANALIYFVNQKSISSLNGFITRLSKVVEKGKQIVLPALGSSVKKVEIFVEDGFPRVRLLSKEKLVYKNGLLSWQSNVLGESADAYGRYSFGVVSTYGVEGITINARNVNEARALVAWLRRNRVAIQK